MRYCPSYSLPAPHTCPSHTSGACGASGPALHARLAQEWRAPRLDPRGCAPALLPRIPAALCHDDRGVPHDTAAAGGTKGGEFSSETDYIEHVERRRSFILLADRNTVAFTSTLSSSSSPFRLWSPPQLEVLMSDDAAGSGANVEELAAEWLDRVVTGAAAMYAQQV